MRMTGPKLVRLWLGVVDYRYIRRALIRSKRFEGQFCLTNHDCIFSEFYFFCPCDSYVIFENNIEFIVHFSEYNHVEYF